METTTSAIATLVQSSNTLFILMGAIMVLAMHAGFVFLEVGTVRHKNQVNALVKIMTGFGFSCIAYQPASNPTHFVRPRERFRKTLRC